MPSPTSGLDSEKPETDVVLKAGTESPLAPSGRFCTVQPAEQSTSDSTIWNGLLVSSPCGAGAVNALDACSVNVCGRDAGPSPPIDRSPKLATRCPFASGTSGCVVVPEKPAVAGMVVSETVQLAAATGQLVSGAPVPSNRPTSIGPPVEATWSVIVLPTCVAAGWVTKPR